MQGGPVLPAIHRLPEPTQPPQFRPLYSGPSVPGPNQSSAPTSNSSPPQTVAKRAIVGSVSEDNPGKKQSKWTPEEDMLTIELRGQGMKWDDIAKRLYPRTPISCRLRYQNYLEKRAAWDEEKKNKLARLYARFKDQMWQSIASEMGIPWRSAESMHWQLGEQEMSARANAPVFQLHPSATAGPSVHEGQTAATAHAISPLNPAQLTPHPQPMNQPLQGPTSGLHVAPPRPTHQRTGSKSGQGRRRSTSSGRRRNGPKARASVPPQLGPATLPKLQPTSKADLISGPMTTPIPGSHVGIKRERDEMGFAEPYMKKRRESGPVFSSAHSPGAGSSDTSPQHSTAGSFNSHKREISNEGMAIPNDLAPEVN
ncbi:hypothetical protein M011DRAFT_497815 [Sporormia fimetaria CBS 119925]|uniref:Myb-like domain-containing protein n=1 Tax=Sporormia fimetaria CBS 119925 TaxID=1340428 RepID=A0A6A6UWU8_9PLEO|nr:hypothetical protein M011DRAFT_497815 [Sporormia fimetaria CBS 119925]